MAGWLGRYTWTHSIHWRMRSRSVLVCMLEENNFSDFPSIHRNKSNVLSSQQQLINNLAQDGRVCGRRGLVHICISILLTDWLSISSGRRIIYQSSMQLISIRYFHPFHDNRSTQVTSGDYLYLDIVVHELTPMNENAKDDGPHNKRGSRLLYSRKGNRCRLPSCCPSLLTPDLIPCYVPPQYILSWISLHAQLLLLYCDLIHERILCWRFVLQQPPPRPLFCQLFTSLEWNHIRRLGYTLPIEPDLMMRPAQFNSYYLFTDTPFARGFTWKWHVQGESIFVHVVHIITIIRTTKKNTSPWPNCMRCSFCLKKETNKQTTRIEYRPGFSGRGVGF